MFVFKRSVLLAALMAVTCWASASPIVPGFSGDFLPTNDDLSAADIPIGFNVNFFGNVYSTLSVNNNGNVSFDGVLSQYTPDPLIGLDRVIIAPYWADVDTTGNASGVVTFGTGTFEGRNAFGVNWPNVGYYSGNDDKLNSFQLILVDRSDIKPGDFDIVFNYESIKWESGDLSGGVGGLGGTSARVGFYSGTVGYELGGSGINGAFLDGGPNALASNSNVGVPGRYVFEARDGFAVPEGNSFLLTGLGIGSATLYSALRRRSAKKA